MSHTATLSHKQKLTNQLSPHFRDKVAQNRAKRKRSCVTVEKLRDTPCHTCDYVARQNNAIKSQAWHRSKHNSQPYIWLWPFSSTVRDIGHLILYLFSWISHYKIIFRTGMQLTAVSTCRNTLAIPNADSSPLIMDYISLDQTKPYFRPDPLSSTRVRLARTLYTCFLLLYKWLLYHTTTISIVHIPRPNGESEISRSTGRRTNMSAMDKPIKLLSIIIWRTLLSRYNKYSYNTQ